MNKNIGSFDFNAFFQALFACKDAYEHRAKENKRYWLREELFLFYGASNKEDLEKTFSWIYNAPLKDWGKMVETLYMANTAEGKRIKGSLLDRAKELFSFLR